MQWDDLRVFLAVARSGQFLAAGRSLKLDHATVSRRVTALEQDLKARLLVRRTTGVVLTAAGERLRAAAEQMEGEALRLESALTDRDFELSGPVRVGAPDGLSTYYLARCFSELSRSHPAITVQLVPTPQVVALGKRETDITIALDKPQSGRFVTAKLTDYTLGLFAHPDYLASHPVEAATPEGLAGHRLIGYVPDYAYSSALDYERTLFSDAPAGFQCTSAIGQLQAVRAGMGIGIIHDFIAAQHPELRRVLPARQARRAYWIVEHEDVRGLGRVRAVHDLIVDSVTRDRALFQPAATGDVSP